MSIKNTCLQDCTQSDLHLCFDFKDFVPVEPSEVYARSFDLFLTPSKKKS